MTTFYDNWLGMWEKEEKERAAARQVIHEEEIEWVETQQDSKIGLLGAPETGFRTWGTTTMVAEIKPGEKTGKHKHGEETIYIVSGTGCTVVNGRRYNWGPGSIMCMPFGSEHQHFNTGDTDARYFAVMAPHLEFFAGLAKFVQFENWGKYSTLPSVPVSTDGFEEGGERRILMTLEMAEQVNGKPDVKEWDKVEDVTSEEDLEAWRKLSQKTGPLDGSKPIEMGIQTGLEQMGIKMPSNARRAIEGLGFMSLRKQINGFKNKEVEISSFQREGPHQATGVHSHMEAMIYCLEGYGYTLVEDNIRVEWRPGSLIHVQGPQTKHQHFNESDGNSRTLRIAPGFRYFFEDVAHEEFPYLFNSVRPELIRRIEQQRQRERIMER